MSEDDHSIIPEFSQPSWMETGLQSCKAVSDIFGSQFPIVGPILSKFLEMNINDLQEKRIKEFLQTLAEYVEKIPKRIFTSEKFFDAIRTGVLRYINEPSEKKRQFILNMNRSLFMELGNEGQEAPFDIYFIFNDFFDQLSLPALDCLVHFQDRFSLTGTRYDIIQFFYELHEVHGKRAFMELVNNALLEEEGAYEMPPTFIVGNAEKQKKESKDMPIGQKVYKIQPLGVIFSDWLKTNLKATRPAEAGR